MNYLLLFVTIAAIALSFYYEGKYRITLRRLRQLREVNGWWVYRTDSRGRKASKVFRVGVPVDPDFIDYTITNCSFLASEVEEARKRDEVIFGKEGK